MKHILVVLSLSLGAAGPLSAVQISANAADPYTYLAGDPLPNHYGFGVAKYADFSGKLTDGLYGDINPGINIGSADPSNWVQFGGIADMVFHFTGTPTVQTITLSMAYWGAAAIYLPDVVKVNGATVTYTGVFPNLDRAFITLEGNWTGNELTVQLQDSGNRFMFMDEVSFAGTTTVPEPSTYAGLAGIAALGFAAWRRRRT